MANVRLGENVGVGEEAIKKACSMAMKAHKSPDKPYLSDKIRCSSSEGPLVKHVFSFPGSWFVSDWFKKGPFGTVDVDLQVFPSLRYLGLHEIATVNEAFLDRFKAVLAYSPFRNEVCDFTIPVASNFISFLWVGTSIFPSASRSYIS